MLTAARRHLLDGMADVPSTDIARFMIALARQSLLNGWMWAETAEETAAVARLAGELATADRFGHAHAVYALYRPLADLPGVAALAKRAKAPWREAARVLVAEPLEERRLAASLPRLGFRSNAATEAVKAQYEAYPYPRWTGAARRRPRPIREVAAALFPAAELPAWPAERLDVLIAGCGTGKHAADVASRFQAARILAVDLSATALGYAARALKGTKTVAFAQADIMALGDFERRFDHIESVGVLHHLADPLAGWRILTGLLKPGGSMRVGFYSKRGRRRIAAARAALRAAGFDGLSDADLRAARAHALAAPKGDPARLATEEMDFYAASGARDFLFHANEYEYRPGELAEMVEALGLRVLGLELTDPEAARRYRAAFPDDPAMADLRRWDAVEAEAPDTFRHMCQFWVALPVAV
jgi:SAM-dependent methyltransferase